MGRISLTRIINDKVMKDLGSGKGKWLDQKFQVRTMGRLRRLCMYYAPRLFMPRKNRAAVRRLYRSLSDYKIGHKPLGHKRAALLLAKADLVDIVKNGTLLDIRPKALLDKERLATVIESSDKTDDVLMEELAPSLPAELGKKRRRSPSLNRTDSIDGSAPAKRVRTSQPDSAAVTRQSPTPSGGRAGMATGTDNKENIRPNSQPAWGRTDTPSPSAVYPDTENSRKRKKRSFEETPPIARQIASQTDETLGYEEKLFDRVKGQYCKTTKQYEVLRNAFFSLNDFEKELNDDDFVKLVTNGTLSEFNEDLLLSWENDHYRREAADIMVRLGKRAAPLAAPLQPTPAPVSKKPVPYASWCSKQSSYNPLVYALRVTKDDTCVEEGFIEGELTTFVAGKLQSDFNMTVNESVTAARALLQDLDVNPGDEKTVTYGQIAAIGLKVRAVGGEHLNKHPKVVVKPPVTPGLASELPQNIQDSPEHVRVYEQLKNISLVDKAEFVALYGALPPQVLTDDLFPYQLEVYNWLKSSGEFSRGDFAKSIQQGLLNSGITTELLKARDAGERPENWARKVKYSFYSPPATGPASSATGTQKQVREPVDTVEMKPGAAPSAPGRLPSINYLLNRKGMPNFGCTCYFNSACQQLSLAIPPETMRELANKPIPDKHAATIRDEFIALMNLINGEYPGVKTRQQHQALEQQFSAAEARLLNACYQHGQQVPGSLFREILPHNRLGRLGQEDAAQFFVAISDALKLNDHLSGSLQQAAHISIQEEGKTYTYRQKPNPADTLQVVKPPNDVDTGKMNWQDCVHAAKDTMEIVKEWTKEEASMAGYPTPERLDKQGCQSTREIIKVSADVSELRSLTFHSNLTDGYYDKQTQEYTTRKLTERGRKVLADGATRLKQPVFDLKTGKTVDVNLNLQSVVVHQGNSMKSGHYTTLVRSQEGPWVLFNDSQPVTQYSSLEAYLAEDKSRTPYLLNYQVTEPVRP